MKYKKTSVPQRDGGLFPCYHPDSRHSAGHSQRTIIRVSCNVENTSWLTNRVQPHSSRRIFVPASATASQQTGGSLQASYGKYSFLSSDVSGNIYMFTTFVTFDGNNILPSAKDVKRFTGNFCCNLPLPGISSDPPRLTSGSADRRTPSRARWSAA